MNLKGVEKFFFTENYVQSDRNEGNDEMFPTNREYSPNRPIRDWYKITLLSSSHFLYQP